MARSDTIVLVVLGATILGALAATVLCRPRNPEDDDEDPT